MADEHGPAPAVEASAPAPAQADPSPSAPAPDPRVTDLQARLTALGRERKAERDQLQAQLQETRASVGSLTQTVQQLYGQMNQQQYAAFEARLATLPPAEAAEERAKLALQQSQYAIQAATQRPAAPPRPSAPQETDEQYSARRAREVLQKLNTRYGLTGDAALKTADIPSDAWDEEDTFVAEAGALAKTRAAEQRTTREASPDAQREQMRREVLQELGVSGALSPRPVAAADATSDDIARLAAPREGRQLHGPMQRLAALREQREALLQKVNGR